MTCRSTLSRRPYLAADRVRRLNLSPADDIHVIDRRVKWLSQFGMAFMFAAGMIFVILWAGG